ncbi:hypothetical protein [Planomonospora venezuelensis]|uniref:Uncharacterized protein n=1 Tax=Planomonospora venezuelensis TaxID=1999 RepID=A0A841D2R0_PLAVE|nr:hypothetical protein [Planomonospora venezuelensis]MBB5962627.1 hypothetical protein [Planomonospora venezuelensis]GIM98377.1 hypothetical protein Pve01_00360 [Planomonospora venezuelensis]
MDQRHDPCHLVECGEFRPGELPKRVPGETKRRIDLIDSLPGGAGLAEPYGWAGRPDLPASA